MVEERLLKLADVRERVKLSKSQVYRLIRLGRFPSPVHVGSKSLWKASELQAWIASLETARPACTP